VKCREVLQCSGGHNNKASNIISRLMDIMKLLLLCILLLLHSLIFLRIYIYQCIYRLFVFNTVIYAFLLVCLCICIVCLCMATLSEVFSSFILSCKANARVKPSKTRHGPISSYFLCCMFVCLCRSHYCLCVYVYCTIATMCLTNCS
jgi:hypothetical protein